MKQVFIDIWQALFPPPPDPKRFAVKPPNWWHGVKATPPSTDDEFEIKVGGFAVGYDGQLIYEKDQKRPKKSILEKADITPEEWGEMQAYRVSKSQTGLHNIALAGQIKRHWMEGKKAAEIAILVGFDVSTVRQYVICLQRAKENI